jgi:GTPase SAR1 family protein
MQAVSNNSVNAVKFTAACCSPADASARSIQIDEELRTHQEHRKVEIKVLLLGAAEAGKSTIVKQVTLRKLPNT